MKATSPKATYTLGVAGIIAGLFVLFSFAKWNADPFYWAENDRILFANLAFYVCAFGGVSYWIKYGN